MQTKQGKVSMQGENTLKNLNMLQCCKIDRLVFQIAYLAGGGPLRLIGRDTNEWQILRGAAPHARHNTHGLFLSFRFLNLKQTSDLAGESPLRLTGRATKKWQASLGAAPHARLDTGCWFLDHDYKTPNISKNIFKDHCRLQNSNMNHGNVLSDCCVLVLVQVEGKVEAVGT
jgi:hypothetical protein